jgi:hypothetical protein
MPVREHALAIRVCGGAHRFLGGDGVRCTLVNFDPGKPIQFTKAVFFKTDGSCSWWWCLFENGIQVLESFLDIFTIKVPMMPSAHLSVNVSREKTFFKECVGHSLPMHRF